MELLTIKILFLSVFVFLFGSALGVVFGIRYRKRHQAHNSSSPVLSVEAEVVAKRIDVRRLYDEEEISIQPETKDFYVTFRVQSGGRVEYSVPCGEYGLLLEGDWGVLTFQDSRYFGFERSRTVSK